MNLPYSKDIKLSEVEDILVKDLLLLITNNEYGLTTIAYRSELISFSNTFCDTLNSIYRTQERSFQLYKILDAGNYYALHYEYSGDSINSTLEKSNDINEYIEHVIPQKNRKKQSLHIQKIMKVYGKDTIILIKPKQLRYWLPSIALRDADEVFADYIKSRY